MDTKKDLGVAAGAAPLESNRQLLLQLAERCEREEPSRALDCALAEALVPREGGEVWTLERHIPPAYTTSIDAAVTLPPDGCAWYVGKTPLDGCHAQIYSAEAEPIAQAETEGHAASALCAAALRARAILSALKGTEA